MIHMGSWSKAEHRKTHHPTAPLNSFNHTQTPGIYHGNVHSVNEFSHWNNEVILYCTVHETRCIFINPFPALITAYDVLDEVFSICRQDVMGRTSYSNSDCSSKLRRGSGDENERLWLAELLCDTLFRRNCMGCTNSLAGKELIPAYQVCYQCCYWCTTTHPQCCYVSLYLAIVRNLYIFYFILFFKSQSDIMLLTYRSNHVRVSCLTWPSWFQVIK